ncbi:hypothetical protein JHJ32_03610 [Parapedobacter sp. ISTM3]|uniref:hypothetical protein n=1 Tax=Parapedobacter sp. ISTM3 TaxID=2800130 RepID=UPI0019040BC8|nr:hypothetical protein [Parapedobacter sp. ISTM3]MBK1439065.1 hypothetical protein [Parapedobacter sp. ISTM3]
MIFHTSMRYRYLLTGIFSGMIMMGYAQEEQKDERPATIDSIDVVRDYRPILADAVKIRRSPDMTNKRQYQPKLTYHILDRKLDINTGTKQLTIQEMPFTRTQALTNNYVKVGAGNLGSILGEVYLSSDYYVDTRLGGYVKHLSQQGSYEEQKFSSQQVGVFGRTILGPITLDGEIGYNRYGTRFYGLVGDTDGTNLNLNPAKQAFNDIYFTGELTSNYDEQATDALSYSLKADAYSYSNAYETKESAFALSGYVNKQLNVFNVGANISGDFTSVKDASYDLGNHIARINPYIRFQGSNYNITLGANFVSEFGDSSRTNIFPSAEIDFALIPQYAHLFGGINGDVNKTSVKELTKENPWLGALGGTNYIRNSVDRMQIFGGIKGNAGATFGYKVKAFYRRIEGMPFYAVAPDRPYEFGLLYEDGENASTIIGLEGELNVRVSEVVTIGGRLNFNEFDLQREEEAWYMPKMRLAANARFNISDKLYIDGELLFQGQTYGLVRDANIDLSEYSITELGGTGARKTTIPSFADLSAGAEYRVTDQIGVYLRMNNMLGTHYERYLFYPRLGLNVIGGVNFSF